MSELFEFNAAEFIELYSRLHDLERGIASDDNARIPAEKKPDLDALLVKLVEHCGNLDLEVSIDQIIRVMNALEEDDATYQSVATLARDLRLRIDDELKVRVFLYLEREKVKFFYARSLFDRAIKAFPSIRDDVEEAGKCLALDRNTACVFHLMRVMEVALRALGSSINDPGLDPKRNPTWERILQKCDKEMQKQFSERCLEWQADPQFFSEATANLRAVKEAWRNPSLHIERDYDSEKALDVFNAVKSFMKHIATKLHEPERSPSSADSRDPFI